MIWSPASLHPQVNVPNQREQTYATPPEPSEFLECSGRECGSMADWQLATNSGLNSLPSGNLLHSELKRSTIFDGKTHYGHVQLPCNSVYQRVAMCHFVLGELPCVIFWSIRSTVWGLPLWPLLQVPGGGSEHGCVFVDVWTAKSWKLHRWCFLHTWNNEEDPFLRPLRVLKLRFHLHNFIISM